MLGALILGEKIYKKKTFAVMDTSHQLEWFVLDSELSCQSKKKPLQGCQ